MLKTKYMIFHHFWQWKLQFLAWELKETQVKESKEKLCSSEFKRGIEYWYKRMMHFILKQQQNVLPILVHKKGLETY